MSVFIVEDGTGLTNATSYESTTEFTSYWDNGCGSLGIQDTSSYTTAQVQSALMVATRYIEQNFKFKGSLLTLTQSLNLPRINLTDNEGRTYPSDAVPQAVKDALSEYAYIQLTNVASGGVQPSPSPQGLIKSQKTKLDVLEKETVYQDGTQAYSIQKYPYADNLLNGLVTSGLGGLSNQIDRVL